MARKGHSKKKSRLERRGKPLSKFVRGLISGEVYFKLTNQTVKK